MSEICPTCKRRFQKRRTTPESEMIRVSRETDQESWNAWIHHFLSTGQKFYANYWGRRGYLFAPTRFPPNHERKTRTTEAAK